MSRDSIMFQGIFWLMYCRPDGSVYWEQKFPNMVVNQGIQYTLDAGLLAGTQQGSWYMFLTGSGTTPAAGDTMASHAGWTEFDNYDETERPGWTGIRANQTVSNSGNEAQFTVSSDTQYVGGGGLISVNSKATTGGTLFNVAAFSANRTVEQLGDIVKLRYVNVLGNSGD